MEAYRSSKFKEILSVVLKRFPHEDTETLAAELGMRPQQLSGFANRHGIKKTEEYKEWVRATKYSITSSRKHEPLNFEGMPGIIVHRCL